MALSDDELATVKRLRQARDNCITDLHGLNAYYEGLQGMAVLGLAVPPELNQFLTLVNWPRVTVDTVEQRLDVEGFQLSTSDTADQGLWEAWQANGMDEESQLAHVDALALRRAYATVGTSDDADLPAVVTVESPLEMIHERDPRSGDTTAALRLYDDPSSLSSVAVARHATLYTPDRTIWLENSSSAGDGRWIEVDRDEHRLGVCPVVPIVNRARVAARMGVSEMRDVVPLTDAAARALTNAQVATEVAAIPQRWAAGMSKGDFVDQKTGEPLTAWQTYFGSVWATSNPDAKFGQFSAAQLSNFETMVNLYAHMVSAVTGIPVRHFGVNTANPPSAEGIRADESRLVKNAERKQRAFGGSWEQVMRLVRRIIDGAWDPDLQQMETKWRDAATPTVAQQTDAAVKKVQAGILPVEAAWEDLGYSPQRRARLKRMLDAQRSDPTIERLAQSLAAPAEPAAIEPGVTGAPAPVGS